MGSMKDIIRLEKTRVQKDRTAKPLCQLSENVGMHDQGLLVNVFGEADVGVRTKFIARVTCGRSTAMALSMLG